jgi:uncharacterized protein
MISKNEALELIRKTSKYSHSLLVASIMQSVARKLHEDDQQWRLVGLLHDLDYDEIAGDFSRHGIVAAKRLRGKLPQECLHAIMVHDQRTGFKPQSKLDKALIAADSLAILLDIASESKKELTVSSFKKQIAENKMHPWYRSNITKCEDLGLDLDEFVAIGLDSSMKHGSA